MLREGGIASEEVIPALNRGLRETFNTDSQTRIDGTSQSIERLRNSMSQIGDVIGGPLASALGTAADKLIPILDYMRENPRSEEHTSELQSIMRKSYAVFCLKKIHPYTSISHTNLSQSHYYTLTISTNLHVLHN